MNVIVTGASRGIGLELCKEALNKGDQVLAVARNPEQAKELKALALKFTTTLQLVATDMNDAECGNQVAAACKWPYIDVLINNAGIYPKGETIKDFQEGFQINSIAPFLITRALLPKLRKSAAPKAAHVTSLMGSVADNSSGGHYAYRASKAALNMINKCLAIENPWLNTIVVHPGWVKTDMGGSNAPVEVADSAQGIWKVIRGLSSQGSGKFYDFRGEVLPW